MTNPILIKNKCSIEFFPNLTVDAFSHYKNNKIVFFASKKIEEYLNLVVKKLENNGYDVYVYLTSDGEDNKNLTKATIFTQYLSHNNIGRNDLIVNVGGGTVCDLGAFVASVYMRGIRYINIPTTLLCAVDACCGGKTAIDVVGEKNLWGTFYQPERIFIDYSLISNLSDKLINEGLSEIVKYAVIDSDFESFLSSITNLRENLNEIVYRCIQIKAKFVEEDEFDNGVRKALNLGHTVAHAVESHSKYKIDHATAVSFGLLCESKIAKEAGFISDKRFSGIQNLCNNFLKIVNLADYSHLIAFMKRDKKNKNNKIAFSLPMEKGVQIKYFSEEELNVILKKIGD